MSFKTRLSDKIFSDRGGPSFSKHNEMEFAFQILHIGPKIRLVLAIAADIKVSNLNLNLNLRVKLEGATVNQIIKFILRKIFGRGSTDLVMVSNMFISGSRSSLSVSVISLKILPISLASNPAAKHDR